MNAVYIIYGKQHFGIVNIIISNYSDLILITTHCYVFGMLSCVFHTLNSYLSMQS